MSSIAHRYTDFGNLILDPDDPDAVPPEAMQDEKLRAFDDGYQAGWTDAEKNVREEQVSIGTDFVHSLQDLAFTYQEALARLNRGLRPMFEQIIDKLIPEVLGPALRAHLVAELLRLTEGQTEGYVILRVSDSDLSTVEDLIADAELKLSVTIEPDYGLTQGQLLLSLETCEREINLDKIGQSIIAALTAFNFHSQSETAHD